VTGVTIGVCESCGAARFPRPEWCSACGSKRVGRVEVSDGVVEETTILRHALGLDLGEVRIGSVRVQGGAVVVARLEGAAGESTRVQLEVVDGAPVAVPLAPAPSG
jgi:uncharacterized OB-fold protein